MGVKWGTHTEKKESDVEEESKNKNKITRRFFVSSLTFATGIGIAGCLGDNGNQNDGGGDGNGNPMKIDGLRLWLEASRGIKDSNGGVETWEDQSGEGNNVSQSDAKNRPKLSQDAVNGESALVFDGKGDRLSRKDVLGIPNDSPRTYVVVCRLDNLKKRSPYLMQGKYNATGANSNAYGLEANTFRTQGEKFGLYLISSAHDSEASTNKKFNVHVLVTSDFSNLSAIEDSTKYFLNGDQKDHSTTPGGVRNSKFKGDTTTIGSFPQDSPGNTHSGEIAEVAVYNRAITKNERQNIESHLMSKYGI